MAYSTVVMTINSMGWSEDGGEGRESITMVIIVIIKILNPPGFSYGPKHIVHRKKKIMKTINI